MKTPVMHFDLLHPGLDFSGGKTGVPVYYDRPGETVPVKFSLNDYLADHAIGAALVHLHNAMPDRVEIMYALTSGDSDRDEIADKVDGAQDTDGDGIPNFLDDDSDDDGIADKIERNVDEDGDGIANFLDGDSDDDGIADKVEGILDSDRDGAPDYVDLDSDGDGVPDKIEGVADVDGNGIPNYLDSDSDGDGLLDAIEGTDDIDQDGPPNFLDLDSDGDGLSDADEAGFYHTSPFKADTDDDGFSDSEELIAGRDPLAVQAPLPPQFASASRGEYADHVAISWLHVAGAAEYSVVRSATGELDDAIPLGGWTTETAIGDYTALPPQSVRGGGCSAPVPVPQIYTYWVKARNAGGESAYSQSITGFRGGGASVAR
jgi:hypothetical protein